MTSLRRGLLAWYRREHRRLPWRAEPGKLADAYGVLVSEAMLQQTQVATVRAYYERFISAFPTVAALSAADGQAVLRLWQGLGYYRRARHLHAAARAIMDRHGGRVPGDAAALAALPGVGRYTAGAVASIAFGRRAAVVDGNVARVLARWLAMDEPIDCTAGRRRLWATAAALVPRRHPGDWNQALMELGATVCLPRKPACGSCPVRLHCAAATSGRAELLPRRGPRRQATAVTHHVVAVARHGAFLFEQRGREGLWAELWQMPTWEQGPRRAGAAALAAWTAEHTGLVVTQPRAAGVFEHRTTHRTVTFRVWRAEAEAGRRRREAMWRSLDDLTDLPLSRPQQRISAALAAGRSVSLSSPGAEA